MHTPPVHSTCSSPGPAPAAPAGPGPHLSTKSHAGPAAGAGRGSRGLEPAPAGPLPQDPGRAGRAAGLTMTDVGTDSTAGANAAAAVAVFAALGREAEQQLDKHLALDRHSPAAARPPPPAPWRDQRPKTAASAPVLVLSAHRGCARRVPRATGSSSDDAAASAMGDCWWWGQSRGSAPPQPAGS